MADIRTEILSLRDEAWANHAAWREEVSKDISLYKRNFKLPKVPLRRFAVYPGTAFTIINDAADHVSGQVRVYVEAASDSERDLRFAGRASRYLTGWWDSQAQVRLNVVRKLTLNGFLMGAVAAKIQWAPWLWGSDADRRLNLPIVCYPVSPYNTFVEDSPILPHWGMEAYSSRLVGTIRGIHPDIDAYLDKKGLGDHTNVEFIEFCSWYPERQEGEIAFLVGGDLVYHDENPYKFVYYVVKDSGWGVEEPDGGIETRRRSLIYPVRDLIVEEAEVHSELRHLEASGAWGRSYLVNWVTDPSKVDWAAGDYDSYIALPPGATKPEPAITPELIQEMGLLQNRAAFLRAEIERLTLSAVVRGSSVGARSGVQVGLQAANARIKLAWNASAVTEAIERINSLHLSMLKDMPEDIKEKLGTDELPILGQRSSKIPGSDTIRSSEVSSVRNHVEIFNLSPQEKSARELVGVRHYQAGAIDFITLHRDYLESQDPERIRMNLWKDAVMQHPVVQLGHALAFMQAADPDTFALMERTGLLAQFAKQFGPGILPEGVRGNGNLRVPGFDENQMAISATPEDLARMQQGAESVGQGGEQSLMGELANLGGV